MKSKTLLFIIFLLICIIPNSLAQFSDLSLQTEQISSLYGKISTFVFGEQISTIELLFYVGLLILLYILFSRPLRLFSHLSKNSSNLVAFFLVIITVENQQKLIYTLKMNKVSYKINEIWSDNL